MSLFRECGAINTRGNKGLLYCASFDATRQRNYANQMLQGARPGSSGMIRPSQSQPILRGYGEGTRPGTAGSSVPGKWEGSCIPDYITKEKQVLRFFAYFQEPVHEGGSMDATGFRVRKFSIM